MMACSPYRVRVAGERGFSPSTSIYRTLPFALPGAFGVLKWHVNRGSDAAAETVPVSAIPQEMETARACPLRPRMVCTKCGIVGVDVRPNWREVPALEICGRARVLARA
jgi:hypothetical protein